jgi:RNA 2',3'-cyclic 3'-phosphodiesterase
MSSPSTLRLFLALSIPDPVRAGIAAAIEPVRVALPDVRWVAPQSLHFTLVFLGERPADQPERIAAAIRDACAAQPRFELLIGGPGCFPTPQRPRVLWLGLAAGAAQVIALQRAVLAPLVHHELAQPEERFSPHLTLGRVPDTLDRGRRSVVGASWTALSPMTLPAIPVTGVHVMRSELGRGGARYTTLLTVPLAGS